MLGIAWPIPVVRVVIEAESMLFCVSKWFVGTDGGDHELIDIPDMPVVMLVSSKIELSCDRNIRCSSIFMVDPLGDRKRVSRGFPCGVDLEFTRTDVRRHRLKSELSHTGNRDSVQVDIGHGADTQIR